MSLVPDQILRRLPLMGSDTKTPLEDTVVQLRLHVPRTSWQWFVIEFDGRETFFGLIVTRGLALPGQFTLPELESVREDRNGPSDVVLDDNFEPRTVEQLAEGIDSVDQILTELRERDASAAGLVSLEGLE